MKLNISPGKYVVAVSGGVDSIVLLDLLYRNIRSSGLSLVVAHFDHGIRSNSAADRKFVEKLAGKYGLEFFYKEGRLGANAGEALAREKRYEFLNKIKDETGADAIVTAHHKDDVLETVIINLLRGTGRKGLSSLVSRTDIVRPLLESSKAEILDYANKKGLKWREDHTNQDEKYLRNYVRHNLANQLSKEQKNRLLEISGQSKFLNEEIDELITETFLEKDQIKQSVFVSLSHNVSAEIIASWLRKENISFDRKTIERLVVNLKISKPGNKIEAAKSRYFILDKGMIRLKSKGSV